MLAYDQIHQAALQLPPHERQRLVEALADSLPEFHESEEAPPSPLSPEWLAEIDRRSREIDDGTVETVPWETVREEMFRRAGIPCDDAH